MDSIWQLLIVRMSMIDYYEVTLQPGKPVVLTDTEREYPRYTHVIYTREDAGVEQ